MNYSPWNYSKTPSLVTALIFITVITTLVSAAFEPLFISVLQMNGPQEFLGLSWWGMANFYLWQPITCLFIQSDVFGISFFFLLSLTFNMYLLWLFGSNLVDTHGKGPFLRLYFLSGVLASLAALLTMSINGQYIIIAGIGPCLLALFTAWAILHRDSQLLLFFLIPVKTQWLLAAVALLTVLIPLSELNLVSFVYYATGMLVGYLYSTIAWQESTSFHFMEKVDDFFVVLGRRIRHKFNRKDAKNKIVDINTGKAVLDDDAFIDEMLAKISRYGERSLTWQERDRMRKISENKMNK